MKVGIPEEVAPGERRVAATPDTVGRLQKMGFEVLIERGAGVLASYDDALFEAAGATLLDTAELWGQADLILKVNAPTDAEVELIREGQRLISFIWPDQDEALVKKLAARKATVFAMDKVPRISRAQKMDALSSMANVSGYRAVVEAANEFGRFFTGQITAAGKLPPAKVLIIGAGVAGLASIGAAKGMGAIVRAFDTREAVRDQVKSLGAEFLEIKVQEDGDGGGGYAKVMSEAYIKAEMDMFAEQAKEVDIVITTALIPGRPAPKLWQERAVKAMKPGSVVVDLAAERGGNCDLTVPGERFVSDNGVIILGYTDLTSRLANTCSQLYGVNLCHLLTDMGGGEGFKIDLDDEVVRGCIVLQEGELLWPAPQVEAPPAKPAPVKAKENLPTPAAPTAPAKKSGGHGHGGSSGPMTLGPIGMGFVGALALAWLGLRFGLAGDMTPPVAFLQHLTVFVLACFVGWQIVWAVTAALHTPLMAVTNAISGIIIVGGILQTKDALGEATSILGAAAVLLATINIAGGFLVTQRMLKMFRK